LQLILARWRAFYREPSVLFWVFGFPILLSVGLGLAFRNRGPEPAEVAVLQGPGAAELAARLSADGTLHAQVLPTEQALVALRTGKVSLLLLEQSPPTYRFDPQRPEARLARALTDHRLQVLAGRQDPLITRDQPVTEPGSRYIDFLLPGLLGANLMSGGMWGVGYALVELRTRKLLKRFMATPMRRSHYLSAFLAVRLMALAVELPLLLTFAWFAFGIGIRGSVVLFLLGVVLGSLAFSGLGLLVASRANNTQTVGGLMNLVMMPMYILSGVFFSASHFPDWMQPVITVLPLTALNDALRGVMIDGSGVSLVGLPLAILTGWGLVSFSLALRLFRWR